MTPKEKALELYNKFFREVPFLSLTDDANADSNAAKECALIAVDEILIEYPNQCPKDSYEMERNLYWQEVKKEIEKL